MAEIIRSEVILERIDIHRTDEDNSEWHLNIGLKHETRSNPNQQINFNFNVDGVSSGDHYHFSDLNGGIPVKAAIYTYTPEEDLLFYASGHEEDTLAPTTLYPASHSF